MKKYFFVLSLIIILSLQIPIGCSDVILDWTLSSTFEVGNVNYTLNQSMTFTTLDIQPSYIQFDNIKFEIDSPNLTNITIVYIHNSIQTTGNDILLLAFIANTTAGDVWFNITGFRNNQEYVIKRNNTLFDETTSNAVGTVSFSNNEWSQKQFSIYTSTINLPASSSGGGHVPINIKILDNEGNPVAFHYVYLYQYGYLKDRAVTNLEGIAEFVVLPGTYTVQTMLDGELREITFDVDIENGKNQILSFVHAPYPQFRLDSTEFFIIVAVIVFIVFLKKITTKK